jgi:hypothetical protein
MDVKQDGGNFDMEEVDLSTYGGVKPEFDTKEREDDKAIESFNAQLLGLQSGGNNDKLEQAKSMGINHILDNNHQMQGQQMQEMQEMQQMQATQSGGGNSGLNFNFNNSNQQSRPQMPMQQNTMQQMPMQQNTMQQQQMQRPMNNMGGGGQKSVSFDNNIKVVEIDAKIKDGFFYSGSKNLDPFSTKQ